MIKRIQQIGQNRDLPRIWIEGKPLAMMGWTKGTRYTCEFQNSCIVYRREAHGGRTVAGTEARPIIDTNNGSITTSMGEGIGWVSIEIDRDQIMIKPAEKLLAIAVALVAPWIVQHDLAPKRVLVACEESATVRDAFNRLGHDAVSCDLLPTRNPLGWHIQGDVTPWLDHEWDLIIGFPECTYLTASAEWAYNDPDFDRYPGVGYHQKIKPETLTGAARREARAAAVEFVKRIWGSCAKVCIENPIGHLSTAFMKPTQIIQPHQFGHPESKATGLFLKGLPALVHTDVLKIEERGWRTPSGIYRWQNQTATGQSKLPPSDDRAKIRSTTYAGVGEAMAMQWGGNLG